MEILQIAGIAVSGMLIVSLVRVIKPEFAIYIVIATVIIIQVGS